MVRANGLKRKLKAGEGGLGCWLHLASPIAAEIVAQAGYDALVIDLEHGPGDYLNALSLMQAASATPATMLVRVPANDPVAIKRALDIGAEGIIVPMVESVEEARAAVAACRYPPQGVRGFANQVTRSADYGESVDSYMAQQPGELLVVCQIESPRAVAAGAAIAAVPGVDMLFIGPSDLAAAAGYPGQPAAPPVAALIAEVEGALAGLGRWLGSIPLPGRSARALLAGPYDFIVSASDVALLRQAAAADRSAVSAPAASIGPRAAPVGGSGPG